MIRFIALLALAPLLLGGCSASSPSHTFEIPAGSYERAFNTSRDLLRESRFTCDRLDAGEGVITTLPKQTSGLATPWDSEQTSLSQELEDTVHAQQRVVRVTFVSAGDGSLPLAEAPCTGRVEVVIHRVQLVGWQPSSKAILQSGFATDPVAQANGRDARYTVPIARDDDLAARFAQRLRERLTRAQPPDDASR